MVRSILNRVLAASAWGLLAGNIVISPCLSVSGLPDMVTSTSPSRT